MRIEVSWDNAEKTIIRYDYGEDWTWEDFHDANQKSNRMAASVTHIVDLIVDFTHGSPPPAGSLGRFRKAMEDAPKNRGIIVIVGGSFFINSLVAVFSRIYRALGRRLMTAGTVEEAQVRIADLRATR